MIQIKHIKNIFHPSSLNQVLPLREEIPYKELKILRRAKDEDDFVEFVDLVEELATVFDIRETFAAKDTSISVINYHETGPSCFSVNPNGRFVPCCANPACRYYLQPDPLQRQLLEESSLLSDANIDSKFSSSDLLRIEVVFNRHRLKNDGKLRIKQLPLILRDLGLQTDKQQLPKEFWDSKSEFLIYDLPDLKRWIDRVRFKPPPKVHKLDSRLADILPNGRGDSRLQFHC